MGTLSLAAPLVLFKKSRLWAGTRFHLLPSFHHHPIQHNYTTQTVTHTVILTSTSYSTLYSHPNLNFLQYTIQILVPQVMWFAQAVCELKIDHTQCHLSALRGTRSTQVQWVGIGTHTSYAPVMVRQAQSASILVIHRPSIGGGSRHFIAFYPLTWPCVGQELIFITMCL